MKTSFISLMVGAVAALASCSQSDDTLLAPQQGELLATFHVEAPVATRAADQDVTRYIVEAYEGTGTPTSAVTPVRVKAATGSLTLALKKNTDYTFLFWADKGEQFYDASSLLAVKRNIEAPTTTSAYCHTMTLNTKDMTPNLPLTLKNATACMLFYEKVGFEEATFEVTFPSDVTLNVATGEVTEDNIPFTFSTRTAAPYPAIFLGQYILAPKDEQRLLTLTMQLDSEPQKTLYNVPLQQNYITNIKGEFSNFYTSEFDISKQTDDFQYEDNIVDFPTNSVE